MQSDALTARGRLTSRQRLETRPRWCVDTYASIIWWVLHRLNISDFMLIWLKRNVATTIRVLPLIRYVCMSIGISSIRGSMLTLVPLALCTGSSESIRAVRFYELYWPFIFVASVTNSPKAVVLHSRRIPSRHRKKCVRGEDGIPVASPFFCRFFLLYLNATNSGLQCHFGKKSMMSRDHGA